MSSFAALFEPGNIGSLKLKNRIVVAAMTTYCATEEGYVTDRLIHYHRKLSSGGAGLIIVQNASVARETPGAQHMLGIYDDDYLPGLKRLVEAVHRAGARIAIQIGHLGPGQSEAMRKAGWKRPLEIIGPSAVPYGTTGVIPREASPEDIRRLQKSFAEAAQRAARCGFDAIEVMAAHGRLLSMFLSPFYNRRTDRYGGSRENRARFICEMMRHIKAKLGEPFPVILKINGDDLHEGGASMEDASDYARLLKGAGADALCVSAGVFGFSKSIPSSLDPPGTFIPFAERIKKAVSLPVIAVGKINLSLGNKLLEQKKADFIAMGRPFLADPELAAKAYAGHQDRIRECLYCNQCTQILKSDEKPNGKGIRCPVNASLLREGE